MDLSAVLDTVLEQTRRLVPHHTANIALLEGDALRIVRTQGYTEYAGQADPLDLVQPLTTVPLDAQALDSRTPLVVPDTGAEPRWQVYPATGWIRAYLAIPIILRDRALGVLRLDGARPGEFSPRDARRLQPLANHTALAIEHARLYDAAQHEIAERHRVEAKRDQTIADLQQTLTQVKILGGLLPICASCKRIRNDEGYWQAVEEYITQHSQAQFTHALCPACLEKLYPGVMEDE